MKDVKDIKFNEYPKAMYHDGKMSIVRTITEEEEFKKEHKDYKDINPGLPHVDKPAVDEVLDYKGKHIEDRSDDLEPLVDNRDKSAVKEDKETKKSKSTKK